jgi:hypothetical protein
MINSNHNALKINVLEYGVGEVSCPASRNVPIAIETAKTINKRPVSLLENNKLNIFFIIFYSKD